MPTSASGRVRPSWYWCRFLFTAVHRREIEQAGAKVKKARIAVKEALSALAAVEKAAKEADAAKQAEAEAG